MDYTSLFYWLTVADNARLFFSWGVGIFMVIMIIAIIAHIVIASSEYYGDNSKEKQLRDLKIARKYLWLSVPFAVLFWFLLIFTPTKKDALLIVGGGQALNYLTTDSTAKQIPEELFNYVVVEIRNMAKEAEVELDLSTTKEQIIKEAKTMTTEELLNKMKEDINFKQIVLENIE